MSTGAESFISMVKHPFKFRMFMLLKLPSAFFSGVRVREISEQSSTVSVPYKWFSQNPFRSTYFACLAMAAEMSTGILALAHIHKRQPSVSMLVIKMEAHYHKKAVGRTYFTCEEGQALKQTIERAVATGEGQTLVVTSTGKNEAGEKVAEFFITWSFKAKSSR